MSRRKVAVDPRRRPYRLRLIASAMAAVSVVGVGPVRSDPADIFATSAPAIGTPAPQATPISAGDASVSQTGTLSYSYPIGVPPGRNGSQPRLALSYSSQAPIYGGVAAGWTLEGIHWITEDTSQGRIAGPQRYQSTLAGGRPLVAVSEPTSTGSLQAYRARNDSSWTRYERAGENPSGAKWRAYTTDGTIRFFGETNHGNCTFNAGYSALTREVDKFGNTVEYFYWSEHPTECNIDYILWGHHSTQASLDDFAMVKFGYTTQPMCGNAYVGSQVSWRDGTQRMTGRGRLSTITAAAYTPGTAIPGQIPAAPDHKRTINLNYDQATESCTLQHAPYRKLASIQEIASGIDSPQVNLPAVTFTYGPAALSWPVPPTITSPPWSSIHPAGNGTNMTLGWGYRYPPARNKLPTLEETMIDIDGDGLLDRLTNAPNYASVDGVSHLVSCGAKWQRNQGPGLSFGPPRDIYLPTLKWAHPLGPSGPGGLLGGRYARESQAASNIDEGCSLNYQQTGFVNSYRQGGGFLCPDGSSCPASGYCAEGKSDCTDKLTPDAQNTILAYRWIDLDQDGLVDLVASPTKGGLNSYNFYKGNWLGAQVENPLIFGSFPTACPIASYSSVPTAPYTVCGGMIPWFFYKNRGTGVFGERPAGQPWPQPTEVIYQPTPLETDTGDSSITSFPIGSAEGTTDLDGDGLADGVRVPGSLSWTMWRNASQQRGWLKPQSGTSPFSFFTNSPLFLLQKTDLLAGSNEPRGVQGLLDLHGDGLADHWEWISGSTARFAINDGGVFRNFPAETIDVNVRPASDGKATADCTQQPCFIGTFMLRGYRWDSSRTGDFDLDGRVDVFQGDTPFLGQRTYLNFGGNFGASVSPVGWDAALSRFIVVSDQIGSYSGAPDSPYTWQLRSDMIDLDGDGIPDGVDFGSGVSNSTTMRVSRIATPTAPPRLLTGINNGRGASTTISYAAMSTPNVVTQHPDLGKRMPHTQWVVQSMTTTDTLAIPQTVSTTSYRYIDPEYLPDDEGRYGFRGFDKVVTTLPSGATREDTYLFSPDWSGRLAKAVVRPSEAPTEARTIDITSWEARPLFSGALVTYHAIVQEHLVCFNGQTESTCTPAAAAGYSKRTSTLTPRFTSLFGGSSTPLMYLETSSMLQAGTAAADGDRRTDTTYLLYADGANYRLISDSETNLHRVAGAFVMYAKRSSKWEDATIGDSSWRVPYQQSIWTDANFANQVTTLRAFDLTTGNVLRIWKPVQQATGEHTEIEYDVRQLFPAIEANELGHVRTYTWEYGTGTKLATYGPNAPFCAAFNNCPAGTPLKEEHRIRVDGLGRMIERYEAFGDGGSPSYFRHKVETNVYVDGSAASVTHSTAIDTSRYAQDRTDLDGHGRPIRKTVYAFSSAPNDQITAFSYRNDGTLSEVRVPDPTANNATTVTYTYTFDSLGRPLTIRRPDYAAGQQSGVNIAYNGLSQTSSEVVGFDGGQPASTTNRNDVFGRLVQVDEQRSASPIAWSTTVYAYDPLDNVKSIVDPEGVTTTMVHDFAGRRTQITRGTRVWTYGYDKNGNMTSETTPCTGAGCAASYTTTVAYDALDRPTSKLLAPRALSTADRDLFGARTEVFYWDTAANGIGRMGEWNTFGTNLATPVVSSATLTYNTQGQVNTLVQRTNAAGYANLMRDFTRLYHVSGQLAAVSYHDVVGGTNCQEGSRADYSYDDRGLPYQVKHQSCVNGAGNTSSYLRNTRNVASLVTKRNSIQDVGAITYAESNWTYDKLGRVTSQVVKKGATLDQVARQDVLYNGNDDPKSMDHWLGATNKKHFNFGYDLRHQLTSVGETQLPNAFTATYTYGNAGRFGTAIESAAALPNSDVTARNVIYQYSATDPERLLRLRKNPGTKNLSEYTYDDSGNQLTRYYPDTKELWEYVYDGKNQLRRVTKKLNGAVQGSEEYWYDDKNSRYLTVKRNASGTKTGAIWFIEDTEAHYDAAGNVTRAFGHISMGTPVARIDRSTNGPSILEYQFHGLANNTLATIDQASGTINASFMYAPFGEVIEATNGGGTTNGLPVHRRRMNDKFIDDVSGLAYYGYRYYDKLSITWTQGDPLYRFAPDSVRTAPRRAMLYTAHLNNALRYLDPDGREPISEAANEVVKNSSTLSQAAPAAPIFATGSGAVSVALSNSGWLAAGAVFGTLLGALVVADIATDGAVFAPIDLSKGLEELRRRAAPDQRVPTPNQWKDRPKYLREPWDISPDPDEDDGPRDAGVPDGGSKDAPSADSWPEPTILRFQANGAQEPASRNGRTSAKRNEQRSKPSFQVDDIARSTYRRKAQNTFDKQQRY
jgi:RHS repeat-associated protein